jgi:hypothetical protein
MNEHAGTATPSDEQVTTSDLIAHQRPAHPQSRRCAG